MDEEGRNKRECKRKRQEPRLVVPLIKIGKRGVDF